MKVQTWVGRILRCRLKICYFNPPHKVSGLGRSHQSYSSCERNFKRLLIYGWCFDELYIYSVSARERARVEPLALNVLAEYHSLWDVLWDVSEYAANDTPKLPHEQKPGVQIFTPETISIPGDHGDRVAAPFIPLNLFFNCSHQ